MTRTPRPRVLLPPFLLPLLLVLGSALAGLSCDRSNQVRVLAFTPQGETETAERVEIVLNQPVAPSEAIGSKMKESPLRLTPPLDHECKWESRSILRCYLTGAKPGTSYRAELLANFVDRAPGKKLAGNKKFEFNLPPFRAESVSAVQDFDETPPEARIELGFNHPVDPDDVLKHVTILSPDGKKLPVSRRSWSSDKKVTIETRFVDYAEAGWDHVTLTIGKDLPSHDQSATLGKDLESRIDIKTGGDLEVEDISPKQEGESLLLQVKLSSAVKPESAEGFVEIEPEIEHRIETGPHGIEITGAFQPRSEYKVRLKAGLASTNKATLKSDKVETVEFPDLESTLALVGAGHYLPLAGAMNLGLETVNLDEVHIRVKRIFSNNLSFFLGGATEDDSDVLDRRIELLGEEVLRKNIEIRDVPNRVVTTPVALGDFIYEDRKGNNAILVYKSEDSWEPEEYRWVLATDLGILARKSGDRFNVFIRSLSTLDPIEGAGVEIVSKNNQVIAGGTTDARGLVELGDLSKLFERFQPLLVVARKGDDFSVLALAHSNVNIASLDVDGSDPVAAGYEAFLYPERDLYRPGEAAHVAFVVRDKQWNTLPPFPVRLEVRAPDKRVHAILKGRPDDLGTGEFAVEFPRDAMTGEYGLKFFGAGEEPVGTASLRVEEFMPDRMKVGVATAKEAYLPGESIEFDVQATYLFGPPVSGKPVKAQCVIEPVERKFEKFADFSFVDRDAEAPERITVDPDETKTDAEGKAHVACEIPADLEPPSGLTAAVSASVSEPGGGRAVTGWKTVAIDPYPVAVGLRRETGGRAGVSETRRYSAVAVRPDGEPAPGIPLEAEIYRREWKSILKEADGKYEYVSEANDVLVKEIGLESAAGPVAFEFAPDRYGTYLVQVHDPEGKSTASETFETWGWGESSWSMAHPERIELSLDKPAYEPGETGKLLVRAPFSGRLLVTVESEKILEVIDREIEKDTAEIAIPVRPEYAPNVHVVATLLRSFRSVEKMAPMRAMGAVKLALSTENRRLALEIEAPEEMRPNSELPVVVKTGAGAKRGKVTIAAVDEGILQLTEFASPDPVGFFFRPRGWPYQPYDLYSMVLPEVTAVEPRLPTGGDVEAEVKRARQLNPLAAERYKPVSLWTGWLAFDEKGEARASLAIPRFNGALRLMAVAVEEDRFGSAEKAVRVREPVAILSSFPRFLAPGDEIQAPVSVLNGTGRAGEFTVTVAAGGNLLAIDGPGSQKVAAEPERDGTVLFKAKAKPATGKTEVRITAEGNGERSEETFEIAVRPPNPLVTQAGTGQAKEGQPLAFTLPGGWFEGSAEFKVSVASIPALAFARSLEYLLEYPYGCIEQTTSKVFPLLYFSDLARFAAPDLVRRRSADSLVNEGIRRIESMLRPEGYFGTWSWGAAHYPWATIYATHFLLEARKAGHDVSPFVLDSALGYLERLSRNRKIDGSEHDRELTYALYVLALAGKANRGVMDSIAQSEKEGLDLDSLVLLAGSYALAGNRAMAEKLLPASITPPAGPRKTGFTFDSPIRAQALLLSTLADVNPSHPSVPGLMKALADSARAGRWFTTQENAFALLALGKYLRTQENPAWRAKVSIGGQAVKDLDVKGDVALGTDWGGKEVTVTVAGKGTAFVSWEASGIPVDAAALAPFDHGLEVRRTFLDENGKPLDLAGVKQGSLVVAKIEYKALGPAIDNVILVDLLPAGLEIENPRLETSAEIPWLIKQRKSAKDQTDKDEKDETEDADDDEDDDESAEEFQVSYGDTPFVDPRDDRMIVFTRAERGSRAFHFALRAVTPGSFVLPPVKGEAMYDPAFESLSSAGRITIVPR